MLKIQKSVYPFDYNKNNPLEGFNKWREYVQEEVGKMSGARLTRFRKRIVETSWDLHKIVNNAKIFFN